MLPKIAIVVLSAWFMTQLIKGIILTHKYKKFKLKYFYLNGQMPSSHSATVSALATAIFLEQGFSTLFIVSIVFALIVMRDAYGVRWQVTENTKKLFPKRKEENRMIGHKFKEVLVGAIIGILLPLIFYL
ncbi:MAG: divergent PAP2 family protein [Nanoarchaeota archaeon]|nr:divergent PAP2 family protein [Nanoarchaeota archaeon]